MGNGGWAHKCQHFVMCTIAPPGGQSAEYINRGLTEFRHPNKPTKFDKSKIYFSANGRERNIQQRIVIKMEGFQHLRCLEKMNKR